MIASVHIQVNLPKLNRIKRYHQIARAIRTCLHAYGIHNSTIQPEFHDSPSPATVGIEIEEEPLDGDEGTPMLQDGSSKGCLFECVGACEDNRCCDGGKDENSNGATSTNNGGAA